MSDFVAVTQDKFYAYVGPRDIILRSEPNVTYWETRGRAVVGYSTPGYKGGGNKTYHLARDAERLCRPVGRT